MNKRKGFFRLTLVLSILAGVITPFSLSEQYRYKVYEVRRDYKKSDWGFLPDQPKKEDIFDRVAKEIEKVTHKKDDLTLKFEWFDKKEPTTSDYDAIFLSHEGTTPTEILGNFRLTFLEYHDMNDYALLQNLAKKYSPWKDVLKRWEKETKAKTLQGTESQQQPREKGETITEFNPYFLVGMTYTILKIEDHIRWKILMFKGIIACVSIWFIYAFIRWIIIAFIVSGFRHKA